MSASQRVLAREATGADSRVVAELFQATYGDSSHPCSSEERLTAMLDSGRMQLVVAVDAGQIVGCLAANALHVSGVFELGCLVVRRDYVRFRLAHQLHAQMVEQISRNSACHLVTAFVRGPSIFRLGNQNSSISLKAWGHDGAMNIARGVREHHVLSLAANPRARFRRALPPFALPVVERALRRLPNVSIEVCTPGDDWSVRSLLDARPGDPSSPCVELRVAPAGGRTELALAWTDAESSSQRHIPHQFTFALFDKPDFIAGLRRQGFRPTAYLPAWHDDAGMRRDCVLMVKRDANAVAASNGFDALIKSWDRRLTNI